MGDAPTDKRIDFLRDRIVQLLKCKPELFDALLKTEEGELIKRFLNDGGCTRIFFSAGPKDMFVTEKLPDDKQTKKKQADWIKAHNFRAFCLEVEPRCDAVKPIPRNRQRVGFLPWKDEALITKVMEFSLCSRPTAIIQLFYEWGFFEIGKHDRILKAIPLMIRLLAKDLIEL